MQAYKEIQVPVEKVKEVYEKFYKELKELEQPAKEKEDQLWEAWKELNDKERKLRSEYYSLAGRTYSIHLDNPYLSLHDYQKSPVPSFILTCERMLEAVNHSSGMVTMTQEQTQDFEIVQSGRAIEQVQKYITDPLKEEKSYYQELVDSINLEKSREQQEHSIQASKCDPEEESGSFGGAMFGIVCLFALVCVMIKSCS